MDRLFAGSMLIVSAYIAAAGIMLCSPQIAIWVFMH
jgi:hypothetical protein